MCISIKYSTTVNLFKYFPQLYKKDFTHIRHSYLLLKYYFGKKNVRSRHNHTPVASDFLNKTDKGGGGQLLLWRDILLCTNLHLSAHTCRDMNRRESPPKHTHTPKWLFWFTATQPRVVKPRGCSCPLCSCSPSSKVMRGDHWTCPGDTQQMSATDNSGVHAHTHNNTALMVDSQSNFFFGGGAPLVCMRKKWQQVSTLRHHRCVF